MIDICGVYRSLELALREAGYPAYFLNVGNEHRVIARREPIIPRLYIFVRTRVLSNESRKSKLHPVIQNTIGRLITGVLLVWIYINFDVILLKSGLGLTESGNDLAWLRRRGKKIICSFHGSDSRPPYLLPNFDEPVSSLCMRSTQLKRALIHGVQHADYVIDSPASAHWQPKICCLRQVIFSPAPLFAFPATPKKKQNLGPLRVLHCPSSPELKGTAIIRQEIATLIEGGHDIEFIEIQGQSSERVIEELQRADLVVDELYSDNYGGIFALEAMTAGVPVVVCGFAKKTLDQAVPNWAHAPTNYSRPEELGEVLRRLIENPGLRQELSQKSWEFARKVLGPTAVAERLVRLVEGKAPPDWFFDPATIRYSCGAAGTCNDIHDSVRAVLDARGADGLLLDDKPELRDFIIQQVSKC